MEFLEQILKDQTGPLVEKLTGALGFSPDQAGSFVPAAIQRVVEALQGGGLDLGSLLGGGDASDLVSKVDASALAESAGIEPARATEGLQVLVPDLLGALQEKAGGAAGLASLLGGGGEAGGLLGKVGGLAGGLFKK